jgi:hypothetical protein
LVVEFVFNGERIRESAKTTNKRTAEQIEAARKTERARGEVEIKDRAIAAHLAAASHRSGMPPC